MRKQFTGWITTSVVLIGLLAFGVFWYTSEHSGKSPERASLSTGAQVVSDSAEPAVANSPFAVQQQSTDASTETNTTAFDTSAASVANSDSALSRNSTESIDVTTLGYGSLSDADLLILIDQLKNDPSLLQQLIDEFRQENDPARRQRLSSILSLVGGEGVTLLASELIYSGDEQSRNLGLSLLQELQPDNEEAREIISGMLATEVEPTVLTSTLSALATPGNVDDASRGYLSSQVSLLTTHEDPAVRGVSLEILSRWNTGDEYAPVLLDGLSDSSHSVRTAAGYALARYTGSDPQVTHQLMQVAADNTEQKRARRAAILALKQLSLSEEQRDRVLQIERRLNRIRR